MTPLRTLTLTCLLALFLLAPAAHAADPYPGTYSGKAKGVKAKLVVKNNLKARLAYTLKTECGKTKGKLALRKPRNGKYSGKRLSRGPAASLRTTTAKLKVKREGLVVAGKLKDRLSGGKAEACSGKRKVKAELEPSGGGPGNGGPFIPARDTGHYVGESNDGLPVSFDLLADPASGEYRIENLAIDVRAECYDESSEDDVEFWMTTHLSGLSDEVTKEGNFHIYVAFGDWDEYEIDGSVGGGAAKLNPVISGYFDGEGNPATESTSSIYCDSYGAPYQATLQK